MNKFERHITVISENSTALTELSSQCSLSLSVLKQAINKGALWLTRGKHTQRFRRVKKVLKPQDVLHFYYDENVLAQQPLPAHLIADLTDYSVWFKPYGMLSQGSKWSDHCSISRWAQNQLTPERPVFIVHRLDKAATGIILIAHSKKAARALSTMFEKHQLEKHYQIIVHGNHSIHPQPEVISTPIDNKSARSTFTHQKYDDNDNLSLIEVKIDSGRKHQIRLHAASIGLPVVGDRLHGDCTLSYPEELNLQLCAISLSFICPISAQEQRFEVPNELMPDLKKVTALLNNSLIK